MTEHRICDHEIELRDEPVMRTGYCYTPEFDVSPYVTASNATTSMSSLEPKPVDRGYYARTFGKRR